MNFCNVKRSGISRLSGDVGAADGPGLQARFSDPSGLTFDRAGNLYVVDSGNCTIRKISPAGVVTYTPFNASGPCA